MKNTYNVIINDVAKFVKQCLIESDNKEIDIDKIIEDANEIIQTHLNKDDDCPIDLSQIPIKELKKQYVDFRLTMFPPSYGILSESTKEKHINDGINHSVNIEEVKETISKKYSLAEWQFKISTEANDIDVALIIPNIGENEELIIEDMVSLGYYENRRWSRLIDGMSYIVLKFDPRYPKNITNDVRNLGVIMHLSPKYNFDSIKKNGFVPQHQNEIFKYPPRTHFLKGYLNKMQIYNIGQELCDKNNNPNNDGTYILFILNTNLIPDDVEFIGDVCYEHGVCTEDYIPYSCVIHTEEWKFQK